VMDSPGKMTGGRGETGRCVESTYARPFYTFTLEEASRCMAGRPQAAGGLLWLLPSIEVP
jgi:hypothetical protein